MLKQKSMTRATSLPSADCFCLQSRMTSRAITRHYNAALGPLDLEITELSLLAALAAAPGHSIAGLADRLAFERTTLVRNLKRLEGRLLVAAKSGQGRAVNYELTEQGRALLASAVPLWRKAQADIRRKLEADAGDVLQSLRALRGAARA